MLEVFRRRRRFYIVFEYVERTVLEELEAAGGGLPDEVVRRHVFQLIRALDHCHSNNVCIKLLKPIQLLPKSADKRSNEFLRRSLQSLRLIYIISESACLRLSIIQRKIRVLRNFNFVHRRYLRSDDEKIDTKIL